MKNLNKVLAMLVAFMMVLSTVAFASSFTDVADTASISTAIEVGVDLGLIKGYDDNTFKPEGEITRAEFAAIVVRLLGQEGQVAGAAGLTQFADVPADHWAAGYINIACDAKVINGYGNGNFGPNDLVEYQDAITMMVRALGYEPAVGANNYPTGYLTKAGDLGLTSNVSGTNGVAINRGTVAQIAFNALDVPIMTQSGFGTFTQYVVNDGYSSTSGNTNVKKTLLSENHKIVKIQGVVESSSDSFSTNTNAEPYVNVAISNMMNNKYAKDIDSKMYVGASDAMDYVGKKVVIFVKYDEFEDESTVASLYEVKADSLVIDLADVVEYNVLTEKDKNDKDVVVGYEIKYYVTDSKTTTVSLSKDTAEYFNGFLNAREISTEELLDLSGTMELSLLNPETPDADYDTLFITAYEVFVVDEVRAAAGIVSSKIDTSFGKILFDEEDGDVKATLFDANGNAMEWTALEEYDVLSVKYVDAGVKDIFEAKVIENTITGTVNEIFGSDDRYVVIDGTEYKVLAAAEADEEIKLGDEGTYYLDDNNNVVYHNATFVKSNNYAYVINVKAATEMENAQVKALTKENGIVTVDVASKISVTYEGEKATNLSVKNLAAELKKAFGLEVEMKDLIGSVVTYKLNASGQINAVEIASANLDSDYEYLVKNETDAKLEDYDEDAASFKIGTKKYYIDESTVIFNVETGADDEDMEVVALANLADGQALEGADIYDIDEDRVIGVIALKKANSINPAVDNATFVTKVSTAYDEDGYEVVRVTGYVGLEEVSYLCENDVTVKEGSLVIPVYKANGDVKAFTAVEDVDNGDLELKGYKGALKALDLDGDSKDDSPIQARKKLIYLDGKEANEYKVPSTANIYVYDSSSDMRVKHTIGADLGYFDYDEALGIYVDKTDTHNDVTVYIYEVEDDVVDVLYYINEGK